MTLRNEKKNFVLRGDYFFLNKSVRWELPVLPFGEL